MLTVEQLQQQSVRAKELGHAMTLISVEELDMLIGAKIAYQDAHELRTLLGAEQRSNESLLAVARAAKTVAEVASRHRAGTEFGLLDNALAALPAPVKAELETKR